jgi:uncharacterized protein YrzB (UPF0473 family)
MADINKNEEMNEEIIIIELTDDEGTTTEFEYLDTIALDGEEYVVLIENVEDADGVIILKIVSVDDENETYEGVEDEEVVQKVYEMFKENRKDDFDFTD